MVDGGDDDVVLVEPITLQRDTRKKKKAPNPDDLMSAFGALLNAVSTNELLEKVLCASVALEDINTNAERGSSCRGRKSNSLLGRWMERPTATDNSNEPSMDENAVYIERDSVVVCKVKSGNGRNSPMIMKNFRVLGLYDKYYNKWFMTGEKKAWTEAMTDEKKKKYKMAVRMMEEGTYEEYDDVALDDNTYNLKDVCKIVDGSEIMAVKGNYKLGAV